MPSSLTRKPPPSPPSPRSLLPPSVPDTPTTVFKIGYTTTRKKQRQFFDALHQTATTWVGHFGPHHTPVTVKLVPLMNPSQVSYNQLLNVHAILHKRTDDMAAFFTSADADAFARLECLHAFVNTTTVPMRPQLPHLPNLPHQHPIPTSQPYSIVSIDPLEGVWRLVDRLNISNAVDRTFSTDRLHLLPPCLRSVTTVAWTQLPVAQGRHAITSALSRNLRFPVILKRRIACGTKASHEMAIAHDINGALAALKSVFNVSSLDSDHTPNPQSTPALLAQDDIASGIVAQEFIPNHGSVLFKVYAIGDKVAVQPRASIHDDMEPTPGEYYCFDSQRLSRAVDYSFHPITGVSDNTEAIMPSQQLVAAIVAQLSRELDLSLIGVDLVHDIKSGKYAVVDINYFPGYNGVHEAHEWLLEHACNLVWKRLQK